MRTIPKKTKYRKRDLAAYAFLAVFFGVSIFVMAGGGKTPPPEYKYTMEQYQYCSAYCKSQKGMMGRVEELGCLCITPYPGSMIDKMTKLIEKRSCQDLAKELNEECLSKLDGYSWHFTAMRLEYHWCRVPVDSAHLEKLQGAKKNKIEEAVLQLVQ